MKARFLLHFWSVTGGLSRLYGVGSALRVFALYPIRQSLGLLCVRALEAFDDDLFDLATVERDAHLHGAAHPSNRRIRVPVELDPPVCCEETAADFRNHFPFPRPKIR
jgi:hypothetical protein